MNSGLKVCRTALITISSSFSRDESGVDWKPIVPFFWMKRAPMFEVMMMIAFLKSTVLPSASVRMPSSKTCSSTLKMSGCAFSISSKRRTE